MTLTGVMTVSKGGRVYHYLRRKGQPLLRLPDLPTDHPDFLAAYAAAIRQGPAPKARSQPGSVASLIEAAMASDRFKARAPSYRDLLRRHFDAIREAGGDVQARGP